MATYDEHIVFAEEFVSFLPQFNEIDRMSDDFWNILEVNAPQIILEMSEPDNVASILPSIDKAAHQVCATWIDSAPIQDNSDFSDFVDYIVANRELPGIQIIILLSSFLYRRRTDAIETISRLILPNDLFNIVNSSDIETNSKRFCYCLLAFINNPHNLRTLMLFESAERAGYTRYYLVPDYPEDDDQNRSDQLFEEAEEKINRGVDIRTIDIECVNNILKAFEQTHGRKESLCFDIFLDDITDVALIFVLRSLRETFIRETDRLIFGEEADLIVLRIYDNMRVIDERSERGIGVEIANEIASNTLNIQNIKFVKSEETSHETNLRRLFTALYNESDQRLQFRELYLNTAPVDGSPILMVRSDEGESIVPALTFFGNRNISLIQDYGDINNIKIGFLIEKPDRTNKSYSIKVYFDYIGQNLYYLTYSTANLASNIRADFENYLEENYDLRVIPGKG